MIMTSSEEKKMMKNDFEIFTESANDINLGINVSTLHLVNLHFHQHEGARIYLKSLLFILVLNGKGTIEINFKEHEIEQQDILLLSFGHFFKINRVSDDFQCLTLYISKDYIDEMYSGEMIYKRVKYGVKMHNTPLLHLNKIEAELLKKRLHFIEEIIDIQKHRYYKEMILNALLIFFLDMGNIIEKETTENPISKLSRDEIYFQKFLELLVNHYKEEHLVDFYADALHITSHYLTLIVKRLSGQTVSEFIFQLVYSEAKLLLQQPSLSVQQIATILNFSDQSAFGKFFKRKSGISPKAYRIKAV